ncbi:hypothetical protein GJ744_003887 [Endocarpon pusillum]|uniref:Calpain catalytic domain-containing protein n=1 Tax=Endocarpon pusillum TaxID=364733 RepID=A0A8H7A9F6_9EURO|nr:hypothetical protein GJ744_003887 [Endocarpon pusillum]
MSTTSFETTEQRALAAEQNASLPKSRKGALEATIKAVELYMRALRLAPTSNERARLDSKCKELLSKAEKLKVEDVKAECDDRNTAATLLPRVGLKQPTSKRKLTTREEIILLEGSRLNGFVFPPWKGDPTPDEFVLKDGQNLFVDSRPLQLSSLQLKTLAGWKRPWEAFAGLDMLQDGIELSPQPTMQCVKKVDLVQDMTSDCSVVASLCAGWARAERGHPKILSSIMFPYDHSNFVPALSPSSKYIFRLYFNGCHRKVVVDDLLPSSTDSRVFHVVDRCNPSYLAPALVEKAYLKVRGGYDFPGSNSGTDLAVLTGWLPEQIFLHDEDIMPEDLWSRVFKAFAYGDVLVTIGTGKLSKREQRHLGLASEHDYAILDMKETDGMREMLIKNPWSDGDVWKGVSRSSVRTDEEKGRPLLGPKEQLSANTKHETMAPGTFWMDLGTVFQHFENLYLNWNPALFSHRQDYHFSWDLSTAQSMLGTFQSNPQFSVTCSQSGSLWLLLNRHFRTRDYQGNNEAPHGFISLYLFDKKGHRVLLSDGSINRGPYVDSPNVLIRLEAQARTDYTVVAAAQDLPCTKLNFTLSALSRCSIELSQAQKRYLSAVSLGAAWSRSTAGGNSESTAYLTNPQFALEMPSKAEIAILLQATEPVADTKVAVHIKVFFAMGSRVTTLRSRDIVAQSGDYRRGSAAIETILDPGTYTIICSTFDAGQMGKFSLSVQSSSDSAPNLRALPAEGSGRLTSVSQPAVFAAGTDRLLAPVWASRLARASLVVQPMNNQVAGTQSPRTYSPLKLTLEQGQGPYKVCLATSSASNENEFEDPATGVRIDDFQIQPEMQGRATGGLWLVLERMAASSAAMQLEERFQILVLGEERVSIGAWGLGDG